MLEKKTVQSAVKLADIGFHVIETTRELGWEKPVVQPTRLLKYYAFEMLEDCLSSISWHSSMPLLLCVRVEEKEHFLEWRTPSLDKRCINCVCSSRQYNSEQKLNQLIKEKCVQDYRHGWYSSYRLYWPKELGLNQMLEVVYK